MKTRKEFIGQYGDKIRETSFSGKCYSIEICEDDQEDINEDFFFRYGKNEMTQKAFDILTN